MLIVWPVVMPAKFDDRHEPVPVQHGHIGVAIGPGVPSEQVIVISADLARGVMVADVVIIGLRQRHMHETENQHADSQVDQEPPDSTPISRHVLSRSRLFRQPWSPLPR